MKISHFFIPKIHFFFLVKNWDLMEQLWNHLFTTRLRLNPADHPIMLAEPSFNTKALREKSTEIMFEKYKIPALFISKNAVLTSYPLKNRTKIITISLMGFVDFHPVKLHHLYWILEGA